jgi:hypothetical protein
MSLAVAALVACSGKSNESSAATTCDPLSAAPVVLPTVVGIGKDKNGVLYVAAGLVGGVPTPRVFVMESGALHEQQILGSGSSSADFNMTFADPGGDLSSGRNLLLHVVNGKATAMELGSPNTKGFIGDPSEAGDEVLALQDPSVIAGIQAIGLPLSPEHIATVDDGTTLVVMSDITGTSNVTRVFYGTTGGTLFERTVTERGAESQDEGILFLVDGVRYSVNFHYSAQSRSAEAGSSPSITGELGTPSGTHTLTILTSTTSLASDTFECLSGS